MKETERAHAIIPRARGGTLIADNFALLTRPLHALHHYLMGDSAIGKKDKADNFGAVNCIRTRCTPEEKREADKLISLHRADEKKRKEARESDDDGWTNFFSPRAIQPKDDSYDSSGDY